MGQMEGSVANKASLQISESCLPVLNARNSCFGMKQKTSILELATDPIRCSFIVGLFHSQQHAGLSRRSSRKPILVPLTGN